MVGFRFRSLGCLQKLTASKISPCHRNSLGRLLLPIGSSVDEPGLAVAPNDDHVKVYRRWHMGHSHHRDGLEPENVFRLGLAADIGLAAGKAFTGYVSGSTAIIADAAHSISDVVLSGVALWSFRVARTPKDKEHPYGHGKFETLGALGISCMLLATAGGISWHAIDLLQVLLTSTPDMTNHSWTVNDLHNNSHGGHYHGIDVEHPILALSMTIISISVKEGLYWITKRAGERGGSTLMKANAWHHRADAVSSVVALIGVGGAILGVQFMDPLAGLVVSGMILKAGIETGYQSVLELVDAAIPSPVLAPIKQTILQVEGVKGCHRLRGRRAGSSLYLDVHIEVDPFLSVSAAHDIGENVRHEIHRSHPEVMEVFIHIDPAVSECTPIMCEHRKEMKEIEDQTPSLYPDKQGVEDVVADVLSSKFIKVIELEHITHHSLQGQLLLQVQVTMPTNMFISDATELAKEAEKEILRAAPNVSQVSIQLRLGQPIPQHIERSQHSP